MKIEKAYIGYHRSIFSDENPTPWHISGAIEVEGYTIEIAQGAYATLEEATEGLRQRMVDLALKFGKNTAQENGRRDEGLVSLGLIPAE